MVFTDEKQRDSVSRKVKDEDQHLRLSFGLGTLAMVCVPAHTQEHEHEHAHTHILPHFRWDKDEERGHPKLHLGTLVTNPARECYLPCVQMM